MDEEPDDTPLSDPSKSNRPEQPSAEDAQASDRELMDALTSDSLRDAQSEFNADDRVLTDMVGAMEDPRPHLIDEVAAIPNEPLAAEPGRPDRAEHDFEADAEAMDRLAGTSKAEDDLESFGDKLDAFSAAGGADNSVPNIGDDSSGDESHDAGQELMDADMGNRNRMSEMLIEHARLIDEINRGLESERL